MRKLVIALALAAAVAGCGRGSSPPKSAAAGTATSSSAVQNRNPTAASPATTTPHFSGDASTAWCGYARQVEDTSKLNDLFRTDPKAWVTQDMGFLDKAETVAPTAIKTDVQTLGGAVRLLAEDLAASNYDFSKLNPQQLSILEDPKLQAAGQRITAYDVQVCHTAN